MDTKKLRFMALNNGNFIYQLFFLEKVIELISKSRYESKIILTGNLILNQMLNKNPADDLELVIIIKDIAINKFNINRLFKEILVLDDEFSFNILDIEKCSNGYILNLYGKYGMVYQKFKLRITYLNRYNSLYIEYKGILSDKTVNVQVLSLEQLIALKLTNILLNNNYSIKDFYDLYLMSKSEKINFRELDKLVREIMIEKEKKLNFEKVMQKLENVKEDSKLKLKWEHFTNRYNIDLGYNKIIDKIIEKFGKIKNAWYNIAWGFAVWNVMK